ncbi:hypothetical protein QZJ86_12095 [Methylomonas montana]|uniref:major capsid protein n=1 Tax=Methylomonas montana TaxID=3058963 RepID=UPI002658222A|nr:hypothetical protein [Methylomonas montana]WKJ88763.1 hypothetical protein QZJ86_12095 [Methylomonas montana]
MKNRLFRCFSWTVLTAVLFVLAGCLSATAQADVFHHAFSALSVDNNWLYGAAFGTTALSSNAKTLADWAKMQDPDGKVAVVANLLSQTNEILEDALFVEGNLPTGHRVSVATGLPSVYWRSYNKGVPSSKATTSQVDEAIGMLEAYAVVDKDLALLNGNTAAFRLQEDSLFLEAMNQTQAQTLFYGNPANDARQFMGLAPRYSNLSTAGNKQNIMSGAGSSSTLTSIWLVVWGENTVFCPFPKGSQAGLLHEDQGELTVYDDNQNRYQAFQTHYQWKNGLCVKDWRYVVRIANIETNPATAGGLGSSSGTQPDILALMSRALDRIPNLGAGKPCFYMNRTLYSYLRLQALSKSNYALAIEKALSQFGTPQSWTTFMGVPLRKVDAITNTESTVS